ATPLAFAAQAPGVPATAGEVEALRAGDAATREVRSDVDESLDRLDAGPVHHHGRGWADAAREVDEVGVDLVLDQRRAGRGAAPAGVAPVEHDDVHAGRRELACDQAAGDAGADDDHVAVRVGVERPELCRQAVADGPPRVTALEIHGDRLRDEAVIGTD